MSFHSGTKLCSKQRLLAHGWLAASLSGNLACTCKQPDRFNGSLLAPSSHRCQSSSCGKASTTVKQMASLPPPPSLVGGGGQVGVSGGVGSQPRRRRAQSLCTDAGKAPNSVGVASVAAPPSAPPLLLLLSPFFALPFLDFL